MSRCAAFTSLVFVWASLLAGCAKSYPLNARMSKESVQAVLDQNFQAGMTLDAVERRLTELRVGEHDRARYNIERAPGGPAPTPEAPAPQLLARVYEAGGFWINGDDDRVNITDLIFVFDDQLQLSSTEIRRYNLRYFDRMLVTKLPYEPAYKPRRYPHKPPPPKDPPIERKHEENVEGAEETQRSRSSRLDWV
jgi:hypothetical protein